jgi:hypothetical protein
MEVLCKGCWKSRSSQKQCTLVFFRLVKFWPTGNLGADGVDGGCYAGYVHPTPTMTGYPNALKDYFQYTST